MRNLLRSGRGSVALATVIALVPLIGVVALGAEAGSWYVTKQRAQNAADTAAYSAGLWLACSLAPSTCTADAKPMIYRGHQFAAQNGFCDGTDFQCNGLPSGTSQTVDIAPVGADSVNATVTQKQDAYLAKVLGFADVTIRATATAQVKILAHPCVLSLSDPLAFQGSTTVKAQSCGLSSNSTKPNSLDFTGNGLDVSKAGSISGQGACADTGGGQCTKAITFAPPVADPLSGLSSAILSLRAADFSGACGSTLKAYGPTSATTGPCYNNGFPSGDQTLNGVYFFTGNVTISGSVTITGTATLILLGPMFLNNGDQGATLTFNGNPTIKLTALSSVSSTQVPSKLTTPVSILPLLSGLLIYDPETTGKNQSVTISGNSTSFFTGITYAPNADIVYQGSTVSSTCVEVIAKGVTLSGDSNFDNSGCPASSKIVSQYVRLVQ
jgi:hypothetical protein